MVPPDVARGVAAAVAADPSRRPVLAGLLAQVRAGVDAGDPGAAERGIAALRQAVDGSLLALDEEGKTAEGRATGAGQFGAAPSVLASEPRPMQASAKLADLARAWTAQQGQAGAGGPGGPGRPGGPKAPAPPASKGGDEDLVTPMLSKQPWAPPAPPAPSGQLPPGLVPEVQAPSPLPGGRTLAREGLRAGGRVAGRFLLTKPNPYLMVAGAVLLVALELMPRADEDAGEVAVTLRQQGAAGQPGREVAKLHMDQSGALRVEPGGRGAVLGQMDPSGRITLTPAGEAYVRERARGAPLPPAPAPGGLPGGTHGAMGNWTGPGEPEPPQPTPQPGAPQPTGPARAGPGRGAHAARARHAAPTRPAACRAGCRLRARLQRPGRGRSGRRDAGPARDGDTERD